MNQIPRTTYGPYYQYPQNNMYSNQYIQPMNSRNTFSNTNNFSRASNPTLRMPTGQMTRQFAMNPMAYQYQPLTNFAPKAFQAKQLFSGGLAGTIQTAQKGINAANQIIPLVNQMRPLYNNVKTVFNVAKAMRNADPVNPVDIDSEIDQNVIIDVPEEDIREASNVNESTTVLQPSVPPLQDENLPTIF